MLRYAISNGHTQPGDGLHWAQHWATQQLDYLQLREKTLAAGALTILARELLDALRDTPTKLFISGRADIALAAGAHGVHLTAHPDELTPAQVRQIFAQAQSSLRPIVSVSCHTAEEAALAHAAGADLILFGPVFEKRVARLHIADGSGLHALTAAVRAASGTPVLALGGITHENTPACLTAGASGIAAIRLFQP